MIMSSTVAKHHFYFIASFLFLLFLCPFSLKAQKTDSLTLKNGDKIIGEIKEMTKGVLRMKTDYSDSDFKITWKDIIEINSNQNYLITLSNGTRINSDIITKPGDSAQVILHNDGEEVISKITDIVYVKAVKESFISRLDASLSLGFNFTKSNALKQLTVRSDFAYTGKKWGFTAGYNSVLSSQDSIADTKRIDANAGAKYFLKQDWYTMLSADFLSNDEQKLKLRSTTRAGMGKYLIHSNRTYLTTGAGLAWNNEQYTTTDQPDKNSLEAFLGIGFNMFDFDDISLNTNLVAYPSLTEGGRLRSDFSIDLKYDLPLDFFIMAGFTYNYDNRPVEGASSVDYVIQTTFGWKL